MNSNRRISNRWLTAMLALCMLASFPTQAQEQPVIGRVLLSLGVNTATSGEGQERKLKRRSELYAGDTIATSDRGRVQIRFSDGSLLSLKPKTRFAVDQYRLNRDDPNDSKAVYRLIKGGMRTVTGLIGREEKEDYKLKTPVATIGIRGTHYSLYFCDAACARTSNQAQGLYGGVARGGIQLSNRVESTDLGADSYIYVSSEDQPMEPLLAPPELLNEQAPLQDEDESSDSTETSEETSADEQEDGSDSDGTDTDESATTDDTGEDSSDTSTSLSSETDTDLSGDQLGDFTATDETLVSETTTLDTTTDTTETTLPATDADTTGTTDSGNVVDSTSQSAPTGALLGVSMIDVESFGVRGGGDILEVNGDNLVLLDTVDGAGNIPVFLSVKDNQSQFEDDDPCNPCTFDNGTASLLDVGGLSGVGKGVNWGRWNLGWTLTENGTVSTTRDDFHFIYSPNATPESTIKGLSGVYRFNFAGGTSPTDHLNQTGSYGTSNFIDVDFDTLSIQDLDLQFSMSDGASVDASLLHDLTSFEHFLAGYSLMLEGDCAGGSCGSSTVLRGHFALDFIGSGDRIIGSWGLEEDSNDDTSTLAFTGVGAYDQGASITGSSYSIASADTVLSIAYLDNFSDGESRSLQIESGDKTTIALTSSGDLQYAQFDLDASVSGFSCPGCELSMSGASVSDSGSLNDTGKSVNWGRWDGNWTGTGSPDIDSGAPLHYIYSTDKTPNSVVLGKMGSGIINYTYVTGSGTAPVDETGNVGSLNSGTSVTVDFDNMNVTDVQLDMTVGGRTISAQESAVQSIDNILANQPVKLSGSCTNSDCGSGIGLSGQMHLDFVGPSAERMMGSYGLHESGTGSGVGVSGTAVFDQ